MDTPMIITKDRHRDSRGTFCEMFNAAYWDEKGIRFVTDNWSWSRENVFRGLHYQTVNPQGKLVSVADGVILDICVDVREGSDTKVIGMFVWITCRSGLIPRICTRIPTRRCN